MVYTNVISNGRKVLLRIAVTKASWTNGLAIARFAVTHAGGEYGAH